MTKTAIEAVKNIKSKDRYSYILLQQRLIA